MFRAFLIGSNVISTLKIVPINRSQVKVFCMYDLLGDQRSPANSAVRSKSRRQFSSVGHRLNLRPRNQSQWIW